MDMKTSPLGALNDAPLLKTDALIGGEWTAARDRFAVNDPATGQKLADVANLGAAEAQKALAAANAAWPAWRNKTAKERAAILMKWYTLLHQHADDLANIVTADGAKSIEVGKLLCESELVRHLSFTGSTEVGRILMRQCATTVKKLSLELGGNAPFIVFDDADIDSAVEGAMVSKYRNAGQTCVCANRLYVQDGVYDRFVAKLAEKAKTIKVGNGFESGVTQGPLIDDQGLAKVEQHVADALAKGATVLTGGHKFGARFYEPTVIANATSDMLCAREETFGPVAPVFRFKTESEAIALANDTEFGLASYFYSRDIGRIFRVGEALEYGMVGVNTGLISTAEVPFGGVKQSGLGREGSHHGIDDYVEIKYLGLGDILK